MQDRSRPVPTQLQMASLIFSEWYFVSQTPGDYFLPREFDYFQDLAGQVATCPYLTTNGLSNFNDWYFVSKTPAFQREAFNSISYSTALAFQREAFNIST